jgi:SAM-dependent methyltransferase
MHLSPDALAQVRYWDRVANEKRFSHPLRMEWLTRYIVPQACVLDFGCGYGRTLDHLLRAGYENAIGIDFSFQMLTRCRREFPGLRLIQSSGQAIPLRRHSADLALLFAVLTCIPRDKDQLAMLHEIERVLRPGGLVYISDLLLNDDARNRERYERFAQKYGAYGTFELPEGVLGVTIRRNGLKS